MKILQQFRQWLLTRRVKRWERRERRTRRQQGQALRRHQYALNRLIKARADVAWDGVERPPNFGYPTSACDPNDLNLLA